MVEERAGVEWTAAILVANVKMWRSELFISVYPLCNCSAPMQLLGGNVVL